MGYLYSQWVLLSILIGSSILYGQSATPVFP
jgi:hypothetical protein